MLIAASQWESGSKILLSAESKVCYSRRKTRNTGKGLSLISKRRELYGRGIFYRGTAGEDG